MTEPQGQEPRQLELNYWFRIALLDTSGESRERLQAESMARYQEVFDEELTLGRSEVEAHRAAMDVLGDPWLIRSRSPVLENPRRIQEICSAMLGAEASDPAGKALVRWLERALPDLGPCALEVVCGELVAHYQDAIEAAQEEGLQPVDAARQALNFLGDARVINDQLAKAYPDSAERKRLRELKAYYDNPRAKFLAPLLVTLFIILIFFFVGHFWLWLAKTACGIAPYLFIQVFIDIYNTMVANVCFGRRGKARRLKYLLGTGVIFALGGYGISLAATLSVIPYSGGRGYYLNFDLPSWSDALPFFAVCFAFIFFWIFRDMPLFRKVDNAKVEFKSPGPDQYA